MKVFIYIFFAIALMISWKSGFESGFRRGRSFAFEGEFKINKINLEIAINNKLSPQLIEYLKSRLYYFGTKVPQSWLSEVNDLGPVNTEQVPGLISGKDTSSVSEDYLRIKGALR